MVVVPNLHLRHDGIVRVVALTTAKGELKGPITNIYVNK
jgi:hypothetical protein